MDKVKFSLKDIIYAFLIFSGVIFNYATVTSRIDDNARAISEIKETLKQNNLELINYKLDEIMKLIKK